MTELIIRYYLWRSTRAMRKSGRMLYNAEKALARARRYTMDAEALTCLVKGLREEKEGDAE